jgi:RNA polymerase sigma factor (sigma-70 family)
MDRAQAQELDELVARYRQGEGQLLEQLMGLLGGPVFSATLSLGIPYADAPDVVENFFEKLFAKKIWRYQARPGSTFWSWLSVVLGNHAKDWHRRRKVHPETPASDVIELADARAALLAGTPPPPSARMVALLEAFAPAFSQLSESEQDLLRLREVEGLDYGAIAAQFEPQFDAPARERLANRLKTQCSRAKAKVRRQMAADPSAVDVLATFLRKGATDGVSR